MNQQQLPLADIHLPSAVSWWPLALGWWILLILTIAILIAAVIGFRRYRKARVQRTFALESLAKIDLQQPQAWQQINEVLKRAALAYYSREQVAALTGQKWKLFLLRALGKKTAVFEDAWLVSGYSNNADQTQLYRFHSFAEFWLKTALPAKGGKND